MDLPRIHAAILQSMIQSGLTEQQQEAMHKQLQAEGDQIVRRGFLDLGWVWRALQRVEATPEKAGEILALLALYANQVLRAPMSLPEQANAVTEAALGRIDTAGTVARLSFAVEERLAVQPVPVVIKKEPPPPREPSGTQQAMAPPPASRPAPHQPPALGAPKPAKGGRRLSPMYAVLGLVVLVAAAATLWRGGPPAYADGAVIPPDRLAKALAVKEARIHHNVLFVAPADQRFAEMSDEARQTTGLRLLQALGAADVSEVRIQVGEQVYAIERSADGTGFLIVLPLLNAEGQPNFEL
jgi:hypothetical protein